ncbi:MAG: hypothetical protein AB1485_08825, partial [Candidatus Thermoplasmatota archaeon]
VLREESKATQLWLGDQLNYIRSDTQNLSKLTYIAELLSSLIITIEKKEEERRKIEETIRKEKEKEKERIKAEWKLKIKPIIYVTVGVKAGIIFSDYLLGITNSGGRVKYLILGYKFISRYKGYRPSELIQYGPKALQWGEIVEVWIGGKGYIDSLYDHIEITVILRDEEENEYEGKIELPLPYPQWARVELIERPLR